MLDPNSITFNNAPPLDQIFCDNWGISKLVFLQMGLTREEAAGEVNESSLSESDKIELIALLTANRLGREREPYPNALSLAKSGQAVGLLKLKLAQSKGKLYMPSVLQ